VKPIPEKIDGEKVANSDAGAAAMVTIDPSHPRPRPVLAQKRVRPAIFEDNKFGTSNSGITAFDAKWSNYGAYLQKMVEAVQAEWDRILIESATYPPQGTHVSVKFRINDKGNIEQILDVDSTTSEQGKRSSISAITGPAPYGPWTDDMKAVLGTSQELTYTFYYE
jgi:hypothetical protein